MRKFAARIAGRACALAMLTVVAQAHAIDTLVAQAKEAQPARLSPEIAAGKALAAEVVVANPAAEPTSSYQPYALALAGALVMAYIGLRRPPE